MARPIHDATPEKREVVKALSSYGVPHAEIGKRVGCNQDTLRKHYREELDFGALEANSAVAKFLYAQATGEKIAEGGSHADAVRAAIFWAKTRMGWSEKLVNEHVGPNGGPVRIQKVEHVIVDPSDTDT